MMIGECRDAFCVYCGEGRGRLFLRKDCKNEIMLGISPADVVVMRVDRIKVKFGLGNTVLLRLILGDRYQDVTCSGIYSIWWGTRPWESEFQKDVRVSIAEDSLVTLVRKALLVQMERGDTSIKCIADEVNDRTDGNPPITSRKVGSIVRSHLRLEVRRRGTDGRYYAVVTEEDRRRLEDAQG